MKASEVISHLQELIEEHGDVEITTYNRFERLSEADIEFLDSKYTSLIDECREDSFLIT